MIKRLTGLLLALLMLVYAAGVLAVGYEPRSGEPSETEAPVETPAPTETPAPAETPAPTETPAPADPLEILTNSSLPAAKVGKSYQCQLEANYGDATFKLVGGDLKNYGLDLSKEGLISGKPTKAGSLSFVVEAHSSSADGSVRKEFSLKINEADATPSPEVTATPKPTPEPTATPAATGGTEPTSKPTQAPTQPPATAVPSTPTNTPGYTSGPAQTAQPTPQPTKPGSYIAYPLWQRAAETVQQVGVGQPFDIKLIEGISQNLTFSNFYGNLPSSVQFVNEVSSTRSCSVKGVLPDEGASAFAVEFTIKGGRKIMLNFRLTAAAADVRPVVGFPQGKYLVPFGGTQNACLPIEDERRRAL